jgi:putative DNA primase/helicase
MSGNRFQPPNGNTASIKRDLSHKPPVLPIVVENIPAALRESPRWLGWQWEPDKKAQKWSKPPVSLVASAHLSKSKRRGSSTDSTTWSDFAAAKEAIESGLVDGIGFVLGDGFCGVDFDNCRDRETGTIAPDVLAYIRRLNTYAEVSPSGEGVKVILRGTLPRGRRTNGNVEMYDTGRYFTVTGHKLDCCASTLATNNEELARLYGELIESAQSLGQYRRESKMDDRELATAALSALSPARADDYYDWLMVGMALHATDAGLLSAWDSWSQQSAKFSAGCCEPKWQSFNGSAVGLGSLIHWAKQDTGWTPPRVSTRQKNKRSWRYHAERAAGTDGDKFVPRPSTDLGNAERFVAQHKCRVRFVATWDKWIVWDNTRWRIDTTREVWRLAKKSVRSIYKEVAKLAAMAEADPDEIEELTGWAKLSEKRERIAAMLALAASEEGIAIDHTVLDVDPWLLNCVNGTVDLRSGELREHRQADLITKSTGVEFPTDPGIDTPVFDEFLDSTFLANRDLIYFLQCLIGYAAVGIIQEHVLAIMWGTGSNGKSTLLNAILDALGDYGFQAPHGFLMVKRREGHPTELTDLFGARFVSIAETQDGQRLDEGLVKMLTGGERIRARRMREDFWEFSPTHTPFLATNYKPIVRGGDYGIWRRLKLIPFTATFVDPTEAADHPGAPLKDRELPVKLRAERGGILRWIVGGCLGWQREGLNPPDTVLVATRAYKDESDTFKNWIKDRCKVDREAVWKASEAYKAYREWCDETGERAVSKNRFAEKVEESGFERLPHRRDGNYYSGFRPNG